MKDEEILRLYRARSEAALTETERQYGALCGTITTGSASLYSRTGNIFVYLLIAFYVAVMVYGIARGVIKCRRKKR